MTLTRRTVLAGCCLAAVGVLAGCTGSVPRADGGGEAGGSGDGPGDDAGGDGSGAGGTRPEGTGGPGVSVVAVDDPPDLPVRPAVEVVRAAATPDHPPQLRTTLTNATDATVSVGEGRAVHFAYVADETGDLILLPAERGYPAEADCWRLRESVAVTQEYRLLDVAPDAPTTRLLDLYAMPGPESCLPVGEYRFETTVSVVDENAEPQASATWGFSVVLE
jgi:hypothetical protein